jgi:very-short-patch-repair endonuclease
VRNKGDYPELEIASVAARQHGVIAHRQLIAAGLSGSAISRRVGRGSLHRLHQGVYAVGHAGPSLQGRWMAAVLAGGRGAVLSHAAAAAHWGLLRPIAGPIDISVPTQAGRRRRRGIRLHRRSTLGDDDVTRHKGIPVTTAARTVADLPGAVPARLARRARRQAEMLGLALGPVATDRTRSDLEEDFLLLCDRNALPPPRVNIRVGRWTVDFIWPDRRLIVETDSYLYHRGRVAFEDDRERDLGLRDLGYDVVRLAERHVTAEAARVAALLIDALRVDGSGERP